MKGTEIIKNKIQAINPSVTDELLDLLYEYIKEKRYEKDQECMHNEEAFKSAQRALREFQMMSLKPNNFHRLLRINNKRSNVSSANSSNSTNTKESILAIIQKQAKDRNSRKNESE